MSREDLEQFLTDEGRAKVEAFVAEAMAEEMAKPQRVPDLPCPKCGDEPTRLRYCRGGELMRDRGICSTWDPDHFHRSCNRCDYSWRTNDVLYPEMSRP